MFKKKFYRHLHKLFSQYFNRHFSTVQIIISYYVLTIIISFTLLSLPFFRNPGVHVSFIDMLFMAVSTVSVTGLTTFNINEVFNYHGVILLEFLFQIGGLGIMMISTIFFVLSRRKISLRQRQLIMTDMNQPRLSGIVRLIRTTFAILLALQVIFGLIFAIHFHMDNFHVTWYESLFYGFYQAISAVTNSGFDVTGASIMPYSHDYFFLVCIMFLIAIGGIGFPVILEVKEWIFFKKENRNLPFRFSLFSKLALLAFVCFFVGGTVIIYILERNYRFSDMSELGRWFNSAFYSVTTRNAGLQLHPLDNFQTSTLLFFSVLMFIGCSPSSVGGGVRTTTIFILVLYLLAFVRSSDKVNIFHRRISDEDIKKALVIFNLSLFLCFASILVLSATESCSLIAIIVEVASAFGTTGLSLGITSTLSLTGKIIIILLMFIGRVGMLYTLMVFVSKEKRNLGYLYPTEQIIIG